MLSPVTKSLLAALVAALSLVAGAPRAFATSSSSTTIGYDISFPQCGSPLPSSADFGVVGVDNGQVLTTNPCLGRELSWAKAATNGAPAFYVNTGDPGPAFATHWPTGQTAPMVCYGANSAPCSYDYGWNAARFAFSSAVNAETAIGAASPGVAARAAPWWLDVETGNPWEFKPSYYGRNAASFANDQASIEGELAAFSNLGVASVGIYSYPALWTAITGPSASGFSAVPVWMPGPATLSGAEADCASASFTGARVAMIQYPSGSYDGDYVCGLLSTPLSTGVSAADAAAFTDQLVTTNEDGTVTYVQTSGSPDLVVSSTGAVTTSGALTIGTYQASGTTSDLHGDTGTFSLTLAVGALVQGPPASGAVKVSGSSSFHDQLVVAGIEGTVTFVQTSGSPQLVVSPSGVVTTSGALTAGAYKAAGTESDAAGDKGAFTFSLSVGALVQRAPTLASVTTIDSSTFSEQLDVGANLGTVTYVQKSGSPDLVVSSSGAVTTSGALAVGTYHATGTTSDATGDVGTFTFALDVRAPPPPPPVALSVKGYAVAGGTTTLGIFGSGFVGRPRVTSHPGTTATVIRDTGTELVVRVFVRAHSRNGVFTFTVMLANGESCQINYDQR